MGYPAHFSNGNEHYLKFSNLNLESYINFEWSDSTPYASTPSKWQAQLQAGPYGNTNYGAFKGVQNTYPKCEKVCINDQFTLGRRIDDRGFEWAGIFEHSTPNSHTFNYSGMHRNGAYTSMTIGPLWERVTTGGSTGKGYYRCKREDEMMDEVVGYRKIKDYNREAKWIYIVQEPGDYHVYMYYTNESSDEPHEDSSYYNIRQDGSIATGGWINQKVHSSGSIGNWERLTRGGTETFNTGDTIEVSIAPGFWIGDPQNSKEFIIADAVRFICNTSTPVVDDIVHVDDASSREDFIAAGWKDRSYLDMRDDGGPSKAHFFLEAACQISGYNYTDNLGLLYAMGHGGLTMMGNAYDNGSAFGKYTASLGQGKSFGEAFLNVSDKVFTSGSNAFILFGAGTLRPEAYYSYVDSEDDVYEINTSNNGKDQIYFAKQTALIDNESLFSISDDSKFKVVAGKEIKISNEFHAENGSDVHLKINPKMTIDP